MPWKCLQVSPAHLSCEGRCRCKLREEEETLSVPNTVLSQPLPPPWTPENLSQAPSVVSLKELVYSTKTVYYRKYRTGGFLRSVFMAVLRCNL